MHGATMRFIVFTFVSCILILYVLFILKNNIKIYIEINTKTAMDYFYCNFSKHELMRSLMIYIT